jgi:hypothetical protein
MPADPQMEAVAQPQPITRRFKFSLLLPLGQLLLCAALLWPVRVMIFREFHIPIPHIIGQAMFPDYVPWETQQKLLTSVTALNIPAMVIQLPYVITSPTKREWMPAGMDSRIWRAVTLPWICLPFWWIAGRAIDALLVIKSGQSVPRIGWLETITGFVLMGACGIGFGGLIFGLPPADRTPELTRFVAGCGLWALLGGLSVIARFRQWRLRKKQKAGTN